MSAGLAKTARTGARFTARNGQAARATQRQIHAASPARQAARAARKAPAWAVPVRPGGGARRDGAFDAALPQGSRAGLRARVGADARGGGAAVAAQAERDAAQGRVAAHAGLRV